MTAERRKTLLALAILAVIPTLLFLDVLIGSRSLYVRDLAGYFYPLKKVLRETVLGGEFPYWSRWFSAGQPMAANPTYEVFYPLTWLILLPSCAFGFQLIIVVHVYIAAFGMFALLRSMGLGRTAALFGATSLGIGGLLLSTANLLPILFILAWLPLTCLFTRRYLLHGNRLDFALAALFFGVQLLIGEPVSVAQVGLLLLIYAIHRGVAERRLASVGRHAGGVVALSAVALLVAAIQILPAVDHARDSVRARGFPFTDSASWSMAPVRLAEMVYPDLLGNPVGDSGDLYWGRALYPGRSYPYYFSIYSGLLVAVLVLSGILIRAPGSRLFLVIAAISLILAVGSHTPLFLLLYRAGLLRWLRYPEKFILMGVFAAIVFAARMLDRLLRGDARLGRMSTRVTLAITAVAVVVAAIAWTPYYARLFASIWSLRPSPAIPAMIASSRNGWAVAALRSGALLLLLTQIRSMRRPLWLAAIGTFVFADLAAGLPGLAPRVPAEFLRDAPAVVKRFPSERDRFRIFHHADWLVTSDAGWSYLRPRRERNWVARNALLPLMPASFGLQGVIEVDYDGTALLPTTDFTLAAWELAKQRPRGWIDTVASMSNVWYVAVFRPYAEALKAAHSPRDIQPVDFLEGRHYPRYYFARQVVNIRDRGDFVQKLASGRFEDRVAFISGPSFAPAAGVVRSWSETANSATIDVEDAGQAFLVMSVTPHKYWRITIDGIGVPAIVTNIGYQGIAVPKGRHVIEMRYRNPLIAVGAAITITTLAALALFAFLGRSRRREESTTSPSPLTVARGED